MDDGPDYGYSQTDDRNDRNIVDGIEYVDVYDALPGVQIDYDDYVRYEREVLTPALEKAGYVIDGPWRMGERDSFGPLSRVVTAERDGETVYVCYG